MTPGPDIKERLIFLHIPKAAGTTLHEIVRQNYGMDEVHFLYQQDAVREIMAMTDPRKEKIRVLYGHYPFGLHECLPGSSSYLTVLRNPVDRVISLYYYILREPDHYLHKEMRSRGVDLETFVRNRMIPEVDNGQVRLLKGMNIANLREKERFNNGSQCPPEWLDYAKQNLREYFSVVGLAEKFDESLILFKKALGWRNIHYIRSNVGRSRGRREVISESARDLIRSCNELDMSLYKYAVELFDEKVAEYGSSFDEDLRTLRRQNSRNILRTFVRQRFLMRLKRRMVRLVSGPQG